MSQYYTPKRTRNIYDPLSTKPFKLSRSNDAKLQFDIALIPYKGNDKWVEQTVLDAHSCLTSKKIPKHNKDCDYCAYTQAIQSVL